MGPLSGWEGLPLPTQIIVICLIFLHTESCLWYFLIKKVAQFSFCSMNVFYRKLLFRQSQEEQARGSLELGVPSCTVIDLIDGITPAQTYITPQYWTASFRQTLEEMKKNITKLKRGSRAYERSCKIFIVKCYFVNFGHPSHLCGWTYRPLSFKKNQIFLRFLKSDCGWERIVSKWCFSCF